MNDPFRSTPKERAIRALKFVKVSLTKDGYLTDISVAMLIVEMERSGIKLPDQTSGLLEK